jgi:hypothetical protein
LSGIARSRRSKRNNGKPASQRRTRLHNGRTRSNTSMPMPIRSGCRSVTSRTCMHSSRRLPSSGTGFPASRTRLRRAQHELLNSHRRRAGAYKIAHTIPSIRFTGRHQRPQPPCTACHSRSYPCSGKFRRQASQASPYPCWPRVRRRQQVPQVRPSIRLKLSA